MQISGMECFGRGNGAVLRNSPSFNTQFLVKERHDFWKNQDLGAKNISEKMNGSRLPLIKIYFHVAVKTTS